MSAAARSLFTIGHSNHEIGVFIALLCQYDVTAVADVRSSPYSRFNPQFGRDVLTAELRESGISYVFLGRELGARRSERECYVDNVARYDRIARTPAFLQGIERVSAGAQTQRIALMCAEKDPLTCHRMVLVCRHLRGHSLEIGHVREDGTLETMLAAEERLLREHFPDGVDLFRTREQLLEDAYDLQGERIQFVEAESDARDVRELR